MENALRKQTLTYASVIDSEEGIMLLEIHFFLISF